MADPFFDVFIYHVYGEQDVFAGHLALSLKKNGLKVWFSGFELTRPTSISHNLNEGLQASRYGLLIVSPVYLTKKWVIKEVENLLTSENNNERLLPILHLVTIATLRKKLPLLACRYTVSSHHGMNYMTRKIMHAVKGKAADESLPAIRNGKKSLPAPDTGIIVLGGKAGPRPPVKRAANRKSKK